jgi:hypothetical protein
MTDRRPTDTTLLITHRKCLDGTGSALAFLWAGGRRDRILFKAPGETVLRPADVPDDVTEVWYADCCPADLTDPAAGRPFLVFDHHISSMRRHGGDPRCTFDMKSSGTSLFARELGQLDESSHDFQSRRQLVEALEAYDLGRFDDVPGQRLADLAATYSQDQMLNLMGNLCPNDVLSDSVLSARAAGIAAVRSLYAAETAAGARYANLTFNVSDGSEVLVRAGVAVSPIDWKNEVADRILRSGRAELAVVIDVGSGAISLRSRGEWPDCSLIAGVYGGGGHRNAAGFSFKDTGRLLQLLQDEVLV